MNADQQAEILERVRVITLRLLAAVNGEPLPLATAAILDVLTGLLLQVPHAERPRALAELTQNIGAVLEADTAAQSERNGATVQ